MGFTFVIGLLRGAERLLEGDEADDAVDERRYAQKREEEAAKEIRHFTGHRDFRRRDREHGLRMELSQRPARPEKSPG